MAPIQNPTDDSYDVIFIGGGSGGSGGSVSISLVVIVIYDSNLNRSVAPLPTVPK